ncbi:hypothetical protein ASPVEDRAFT_85923 [Aspergillus versicolor CBS 583.65]|uniref:Life-span regulatory factor domain-containing protein n=1 Tax=Aspergillus versicolor CBS 583.65 TaxID=1036611 RepID=A0A1L9PSN2_ASPVE|nr:uncharacterized protein ASPVEDRAFT_85923 [Aspergillus versicolor CBS 583.65]OJJ04538.1 hypothetical protein ASPVEDRAFT_85923 [Aspergillus versicolor CBS 583.65]
MTQSHGLSHHRRSPSGSNSSKRTARPAIHRRGTSFANISASKLGSGQVRAASTDDDRTPEMAASFLNYCAMCEKQITVPDNRLLYCSESCRRKDTQKPLSASLSYYNTISPPITPPSSPPMSPPTIVAPLTPTKLPVTASQPIRIPTDTNDVRTDIDPTEWKPVIPSDRHSPSLMTSDAWKYLCKFHGDEPAAPIRRSKGHNQSSSSLSTLPSLSHTVASTPSSLSSTASDYMGHMYEPAHRPLPPRHKPCFSSSGGAKSVELVVPHIEMIPDSPVNTSNSGSIFPASSGLWNDNTKTTPAIAVSDEN